MDNLLISVTSGILTYLVMTSIKNGSSLFIVKENVKQQWIW